MTTYSTISLVNTWV